MNSKLINLEQNFFVATPLERPSVRPPTHKPFSYFRNLNHLQSLYLDNIYRDTNSFSYTIENMPKLTEIHFSIEENLYNLYVNIKNVDLKHLKVTWR